VKKKKKTVKGFRSEIVRKHLKNLEPGETREVKMALGKVSGGTKLNWEFCEVSRGGGKKKGNRFAKGVM